MSQLVATIDGREVYSDKTVESIVNTRVTFTDGSWCEIRTGQAVNKGPGYINIGSPEEDAEEKKTYGPESFAATALDVRNLPDTDLDIQPYNGGEIEVSATGPSSTINALQVIHRGNTVHITSTLAGKQGGSVSIVTGSGRSVVSVSGISGSAIAIGGSVISGRSIIVAGGEKRSTKVTVKVPVGSHVCVANIDGMTTIGDTEGSLQINAIGRNDFDVGNVKDTVVNAQGSSDVNINKVNGSLSATVQGSGDVYIRSGSASTLQIAVQGSGDVDFRGNAENANLSVMGSGDIYVAHVTNQPTITRMGSGSVRVGNW